MKLVSKEHKANVEAQRWNRRVLASRERKRLERAEVRIADFSRVGLAESAVYGCGGTLPPDAKIVSLKRTCSDPERPEAQAA